MIETIMNLCKGILSDVPSIVQFKQLLGQFNTFPEDESKYQNLFNCIMLLLPSLMTTKTYNDIFVFSGRANSGIGLLTKKELPTTGYCFCGSIRIERRDPKEMYDTEYMIIFKLGCSKEREIELYLENGYLNYKVMLLLK